MARITIRGKKADAARGIDATEDTTAVSEESKKEHASPLFVLVAYVLVVAGVVLGSLLATTWLKTKLEYDLVDSMSLFAVFYIVAQAMERFVEPISELSLAGFGGSRKDKERQRDKAMVDEDAGGAADAQAEANQIKANTKVAIWGIASFCSMLVSGAMGLYLLETIGVKGVPEWLNILITGLAVGGGTKPLHELIKLIEKKSDEDDSADDGSDGS